MKLTFLVLALVSIGALNTPQLAQADVSVSTLTVEDSSATRGDVWGGPEVPFPLSAQVDFPWATIEGVWQAKGKVTSTEFSFHISSNGNSGRILEVVQVGADGKTVVSTGVGYSNDNDDRTVRAVMVSRDGSPTYWLIIRAFKNDKTGKIETVLTVRTFDSSGDDGAHIVVRKLSSQPVAMAADGVSCLN